jgi:hypothetical protein
VVYDPVIRGRRCEFGVSGRLYRRNLLFFDRQTDSLWSQLLAEAVTGPMAGVHLAMLPAENTTWKAWTTAHPNTLVLSFNTAYQLDYSQDPYAAEPIPRDPALFVSAAGVNRIYPFSEIKKAREPVAFEFAGHWVTITNDQQAQTAGVEDAAGAGVSYFAAFLADLEAFYPEAEIYRARRK